MRKPANWCERFDGITRAATSVAFAANGQKLIVTSFDEKAYVFEVESGKPVGFFGDTAGPVNGDRDEP